MNLSINETLSRTILTGGVTLITTLVLFFGYSVGSMSIGWILLIVVIIVGWGGTKLIYNKSAAVAGM